MIGNPFDFPVAWDSILVDTLATAEAEGVVVEPPVGWDISEGYQYGVEILEPFEGYWVKNLGDSNVVLRIPPREAAGSAAQNGPPVLAMGPVDSVVSGGTACTWVALGSSGSPISSMRSSCAAPADGWRVEIRASSCGAVDFTNFVGVSGGGQTGWDRYDRSEPPMSPGKSLSLYFPHPDWAKHAGNYSCDTRGGYERLETGTFNLAGSGERYETEHEQLAAGELKVMEWGKEIWGQVWRFDVAKNFREADVDEVGLEFVGVESVPAGAEGYLVDRVLGRLVDLRKEARYCFHLGDRAVVSADEEPRFALVVGSDEFIDEHGDELPKLPSDTMLRSSYPNPFRATTLIRYDIARAGRVRLSIYDVKGELVSVLCDEDTEPGRYEVCWNSTNMKGQSVAAGIYFARLDASARVLQRKLLLVK
jgi:hypothetical protein